MWAGLAPGAAERAVETTTTAAVPKAELPQASTPNARSRVASRLPRRCPRSPRGPEGRTGTTRGCSVGPQDRCRREKEPRLRHARGREPRPSSRPSRLLHGDSSRRAREANARPPRRPRPESPTRPPGKGGAPPRAEATTSLMPASAPPRCPEKAQPVAGGKWLSASRAFAGEPWTTAGRPVEFARSPPRSRCVRPSLAE